MHPPLRGNEGGYCQLGWATLTSPPKGIRGARWGHAAGGDAPLVSLGAGGLGSSAWYSVFQR